MNPFHDKSPAELLAMVPGLSDPGLDALCAAMCDGEWVRYKQSFVRFRVVRGERGWWWVEDYTSDPREAMRLLVKYRLNIKWLKDPIDEEEFLSVRPERASEFCFPFAGRDPLQLLCRLTAEQAATCELARIIEGEHG